jgi:hypothetical protein
MASGPRVTIPRRLSPKAALDSRSGTPARRLMGHFSKTICRTSGWMRPNRTLPQCGAPSHAWSVQCGAPSHAWSVPCGAPSHAWSVPCGAVPPRFLLWSDFGRPRPPILSSGEALDSNGVGCSLSIGARLLGFCRGSSWQEYCRPDHGTIQLACELAVLGPLAHRACFFEPKANT